MVMKTDRRKTTQDARGSLFWLFLVVHCLIGSVAAAVELTDEERERDVTLHDGILVGSSMPSMTTLDSRSGSARVIR